MRFVEIEEAKSATGLRLVVVGGVPSPWTEGAKGIFDAKGIDYLAVRTRPKDEAVRSWTGCHNVPVVLWGDELPRTGWAEILALGERLGGRLSLIPEDADERVLMFGLAHEILGEWGLAWCTRLLLVHAGLKSGGAQGLASGVSAYLGKKYGYLPDRIPAARLRILEVLRMLVRRLQSNRPYLVGNKLTAVDLYTAVALGPLVPLPLDLCPTLPMVHRAYETSDPALAAEVPREVIVHRDFVYQRHLTLPVQL